ncbi:MAG: serine/threonine-protein kinase [Mariprofundaceae bacterium]|nr:serine/threonine-protein kinase [Mariprofundaceae bacterium]
MHCPSCNAQTPKAQGFCKHCGIALFSGDEAPHIGPYRLEAKLGEGGMGVVYRATDKKLNREVAVKILHPQMLKQESLMERFRREARMHAKIIHPNIVTLLSLYEDEGHIALVMEMVHGQNLREYLRQNSRPAQLDVIRITEAVCSGLEAAHKLGVIHRDLKPANILLATDGAIKLMDFGLAKPKQGSDDLTQSGATVGSFRYMAPEQILNQPIDARTDLYALGILMYQMTTGKLPFNASADGGGEFEIMEKQVRHNPESPHKLNPALSPAMSDLIMSLLAKDPDERPASCESVHKMLASIARQAEHPQINISYSHSTSSQNNVEIAKGLLHSWNRRALRLLWRGCLSIKTYALDIPYRWVKGKLWPLLAERMNLPDRLQAPMVWGMIIILIGGLGWGLISLIQMSERASPVSEVKREAPKPSPVRKEASQVVKKSPSTVPRQHSAKVKAASVKRPVKKPVKKSVSAHLKHKKVIKSSLPAQSKKKTQVKHKTRIKSTHVSRAIRAATKPITYRVPYKLVRSDGSRIKSGIHEFSGGKRIYFPQLSDYVLKDKLRLFKSGWIRLYLKKPVKLSRIVIHLASVGKRTFKDGELRLEVQDHKGHWQTLLLRKDHDISKPLTIRKPKKVLADVKGVKFKFKTSEPITIGPIDLLP